ncbi:MAG: RNA polymerase sigma-70 factor [Rikenellaceae bacterium]|nr:RNA polymerase sigma-70 factor [Rikenellaceae bacterium]
MGETVGISSVEFGRLFSRYRHRFETVARRYVRDGAVAEDIVSDSFMAFWAGRERLAEDSNIPAYILTIVRNKCLDWLRAQSLHTRIEKEVYDLRRRTIAADIRSLAAFDPSELFSDEIAAIVERTLDSLPELTRNVFIARRFSDMSYREIAEKYSISLRRVEFELDKSVKYLRAALKDYLPAMAIMFLLGDVIPPC